MAVRFGETLRVSVTVVQPTYALFISQHGLLTSFSSDYPQVTCKMNSELSSEFCQFHYVLSQFTVSRYLSVYRCTGYGSS